MTPPGFLSEQTQTHNQQIQITSRLKTINLMILVIEDFKDTSSLVC